MFYELFKQATIYDSLVSLSSKFEKEAALSDPYEHKYKVEHLSKENTYPFKDWFGENGRTYVPFKGAVESTMEPSKYLVGLLAENGWEISDYQAGHATKGNRTQRIGKILNQLKIQEKQKFEKLYQEATQQNEDEYALKKIKEDYNQQIKFLNETEVEFTTDPLRADQNSALTVVFSQNPHDIATMSTGRDWESCMTLGTGKHQDQVFCEVANGGLIAYLIKSNDIEIERPIARIHIRRFDAQDGGHIAALPEKTVYGTSVAGFQEFVNSWIGSKSSNVMDGVYILKGGKWSDTYSGGQDFFFQSADKEKLLAYLNGYIPPGIIYTEYTVDDKLYEYIQKELEELNEYEDNLESPILDLTKSFTSKEAADKYLEEIPPWVDGDRDFIENQEEGNYYDNEEEEENTHPWLKMDEDGNFTQRRFEIRKTNVDNSMAFVDNVISKLLKYPKGELDQETIEKIKQIALKGHNAHDQKIEFLNTYPETLNGEEFENLNTYYKDKVIKYVSPEIKEASLNNIAANINEGLDEIINPDHYNNMQSDIKSNNVKNIMGKIYSILEDVKLFDKVPESIMQKLYNLTSALEVTNDPRYTDYYIDKAIIANLIPYDNDIKSQIIKRQILDDRDVYKTNLIPMGFTLSAAARLGEEGTDLLPKLAEMLEYYKEKKMKEQAENVLYTIDAIKNKTGRSNKYRFHY